MVYIELLAAAIRACPSVRVGIGSGFFSKSNEPLGATTRARHQQASFSHLALLLLSFHSDCFRGRPSVVIDGVNLPNWAPMRPAAVGPINLST